MVRGRHKPTVPSREIVRLYNLTNSVNLPARYNIAPTQDVLVVVDDAETNMRRGEMMRRGLVPFGAKDAKIGYSLINAMAETVAEKPAFREAFKKRRCIVVADGFYEWQKIGSKRKRPYLIAMKDERPFGFAGLWETWTDQASGETIRSCTIITTAPNAVCAPIHNRMPVILDPGDYVRWLGERPVTSNELQEMLRPYYGKPMKATKIGPKIGNAKNEGPELVQPA